MGDEVSKAEWARRRKQLDADLAADEKAIKSSTAADSVGKAYDRYTMDKSYKQAYGKELGYSAAPQKAAPKKVKRKRTTK